MYENINRKQYFHGKKLEKKKYFDFEELELKIKNNIQTSEAAIG